MAQKNGMRKSWHAELDQPINTYIQIHACVQVLHATSELALLADHLVPQIAWLGLAWLGFYILVISQTTIYNLAFTCSDFESSYLVSK